MLSPAKKESYAIDRGERQNDKEKYSGGGWIYADAEIDKIPLFVKAGSIIPMINSVSNTKEAENKKIILNIYPGQDAHFNLYNDSGDGYGYEKGEYSICKIKWNENKQRVSCDGDIGNFEIRI